LRQHGWLHPIDNDKAQLVLEKILVQTTLAETVHLVFKGEVGGCEREEDKNELQIRKKQV
jgi:hypothetical protein